MPVFDPDNARIRMAALTKPGKANITWYSLEKYNKSAKPNKDIIAGMLRRLMDSKHIDDVQVIIFYDNKTNSPIERYDK